MSQTPEPKPPEPKPKQPAQGLGIVALVLGICAVFLSFSPFTLLLGWLCGIAGIICAVAAKGQDNKGGIATAGLVCSVVGIALGLMVFVACTSFIVPFI
ncbi:MAG: hypothetical protein FWC93_05575 [Defluviitaleaceae bacterium]|nr:hypothetical protein [Defluviitaleaceae bacterium]